MKKNFRKKILLQPKFKTLILNIGICLLYIISGKLGLRLATVNPSATAIWPPTGIALASLLLFGTKVIPAIFIGSFFVNLTTAGTALTSLGIGIGNTLEAFAGSYLINRYADGIHVFSKVSTIVKFCFIVAIATTVSANIGISTLLFGHLTSWQNFIPVWITWWLGDIGGAFVLTPLFVIWNTSSRPHLYFKKTMHLIISFFILLLSAWIVFSGILPYSYLCIPIGIWIAFWFGRRGATIMTFTVAGIAIFYTSHNFGPFVRYPNNSLLLLQLFLGVLSLTSLTFATLVHTIRKGEKTLALHDARFKALIEKSFDGILLIDTASIILYASPSVNRILGYEPDELIGITGFNLVIPEDRLYTMRTLAKLVLKPGDTVTIQYRAARKDKSIIWVEATGTNLIFDSDINAVVVNFRDITEKKALEEKMLREKTEDEAMLASIGDGIIATDYFGKITMVNHSACVKLGWTKKELLGKLITDAIPMEDESGTAVLENERPMTKVLSQKRKIVISQTYYYQKKDKTKFPVRFIVTPIIIDKKITGIIEVFQDITREKEIDRMKDEFISMASHELRTPMTAVNGLLSMILNGDYGPINEHLKHPLNNIRVSAERQIHLINDLLDASRLQSGKIDLSITDFSQEEVIEEVIKTLKPIAQQKKIQLLFEKKDTLITRADSEWTKHILNNIIGNALKFTEKGKVVISSAARGDFVMITVQDTGVGIAFSDREKLFGKFQQLNGQTANKPSGSGLGLYLSRELARKMGGDIEILKSSPKKGSTFIISLPLTKITDKEQTEIINKKKIAFSSH